MDLTNPSSEQTMGSRYAFIFDRSLAYLDLQNATGLFLSSTHVQSYVSVALGVKIVPYAYMQ